MEFELPDLPEGYYWKNGIDNFMDGHAVAQIKTKRWGFLPVTVASHKSWFGVNGVNTARYAVFGAYGRFLAYADLNGIKVPNRVAIEEVKR